MTAAIDINNPEPGHYKRRLVKGGPWVPVRIWVEDGERDPETGELMSDQIIKAEVDGEDANPFEQWSYCAGHPITESEFNYMRGTAAWDRDNDPDAPAANPRQAIDINRTKPVF